MEIRIADNAGVGITYDYRIHQRIRKLAQRRAPNADYFEILSNIQPDIRAAVTRDIDAAVDAARRLKDKEKGKDKGGKEKKDRKGQGKGQPGREVEATPVKEGPKKGPKWTKEDWAAWRKKLEEQKPDDRTPAPDANKERKDKEK